MAMQMLGAGGLAVVTDGLRKAGEDNPKGYYEDERVKDLHKDEEQGKWLKESRGRAIKIISFLLKDLPETNNYKVIFMRRELSEVLTSQKKMLERRGETDGTTDERMLEIWADHLWRVDYLFSHAGHLEHLELFYKDVVENPLEQARRMVDFLGRNLDPKAMATAVDVQLYRNRG
jgi:hypothetical protein